MNQVKSKLIEARALLKNETTWYAGVARSGPWREHFHICAESAVDRVCLKNEDLEVYNEKLVIACLCKLEKLAPSSVRIYNDSHTHAEVLRLFDLAIKGEKDIE